MTLLSTKDDFLERTLAKVSGLWGKLEYLSRLREEGRYVHWGLTRIYGEEAMQRTLAEVHRGLLQEILRTPLRSLKEDLVSSAAGEGIKPKAYVRSLGQRFAALLPPDPAGGSESHFKSVIAALSGLLR